MKSSSIPTALVIALLGGCHAPPPAPKEDAPKAAETARETERTKSRAAALKHAETLKKVAAAQKLKTITTPKTGHEGHDHGHEGHDHGDSHKPGDIKWGTAVDWMGWEAGLAAAKKGDKPICLVVYADWCPRCKELAPLFSDPELTALAKDFVMVLQDADEKPDWLVEQFNKPYGGYVPRIFFLDPKGDVRTDITSGNDRYPYFYTPRGREALVRSMKQARG